MADQRRVLLDEEVIEEDPRLRRAVMVMVRRLTKFMRKEFNGQNVARMIEITRECRTHFRRQGIDFPELVPIVLPSLGTIDFFRADLDAVGIQAAMQQTIGKYHGRGMNPQELAMAVQAAWPHFKPLSSELDRALAQQRTKWH